MYLPIISLLLPSLSACSRHLPNPRSPSRRPFASPSPSRPLPPARLPPWGRRPPSTTSSAVLSFRPPLPPRPQTSPLPPPPPPPPLILPSLSSTRVWLLERECSLSPALPLPPATGPACPHSPRWLEHSVLPTPLGGRPPPAPAVVLASLGSLVVSREWSDLYHMCTSIVAPCIMSS